jgi:AraC-like DNA-binding protein
MLAGSVRYREFAPCEALRDSVSAVFSFTAPAENDAAAGCVTREAWFGAGDRFCSPFFADGHVSMVFSLQRTCGADGVWRPRPAGPRGDVIGPMTRVGEPSLAERAEMVGVYLRAARGRQITGVPAAELRDRIVGLEELWGPAAFDLASRLSEVKDESARIGCLESALLKRNGQERGSSITIDVTGLAAWVERRRGQVTVESLADAAGVSRQHLARAFRESVGVTPKLYCRLARFQATLGFANRGDTVDWAHVAAHMNYADQSHMIAEFREFSSLTPQMLATQRWFHPFIERARAREEKP